jgi:uncharacterized protein YdhG (YjbR/CyaY superfamily)
MAALGKIKATSIDEYLAGVSGEQRAALQKLRKTIKAVVPKAEECINYGVAAFRLDGKVLVGFGAAKNHCTFFPMSGRTVHDHKDDLKEYETSKGAIRFQPGNPLPVALVRKLIKARIAENERKQAPRKAEKITRRSS